MSTDPGVKLAFSEHMVLFDTIFTTVGSTTHRLTVYNPNNEAVNINSISISGPSEAYFRMNVDGIPGKTVNNIFLAAKDSLFIFIDVTIDPNNSNTPFLVEGKIQCNTNGNLQEVPLVAYGQQAIFYTPTNFPENIPPYSLIESGENKSFVFKKDTPIVIYGYLVIDSLQSLTIEAGTQLYFHANSGIWVYRYGEIHVEGTPEEPVVFQGDRLDGYKDISGSWDRIWINDGGTDNINTIDWAIIKNAFIGIQAEYKPFSVLKDNWSANLLLITNTVMENCKLAGIYATNYQIFGANVSIEDCGGSNFAVVGGGYYNFSHCTFANYWRGEPRNSPAVYLSNFYFHPPSQSYIRDTMVVNFENCIIYGDKESEFNIEDELDPLDGINYTMHHTLLKSDVDATKYGKYVEAILNPENTNIFAAPNSGNFSLYEGSPAVDQGDPGILTKYPIFQNTLMSDIVGTPRTDGKPDPGAFELE